MDEDRLTGIERGIAELKAMFEERFDAVDRRFETVATTADMDRRFEAVATTADMDRRFEAVPTKADMDRRFDAVATTADMDRRFDAVATKADMDRRFDETQGQLKALIEDVRDDVRIVLEGHVALERRVTKLERRER